MKIGLKIETYHIVSCLYYFHCFKSNFPCLSYPSEHPTLGEQGGAVLFGVRMYFPHRLVGSSLSFFFKHGCAVDEYIRVRV